MKSHVDPAALQTYLDKNPVQLFVKKLPPKKARSKNAPTKKQPPKAEPKKPPSAARKLPITAMALKSPPAVAEEQGGLKQSPVAGVYTQDKKPAAKKKKTKKNKIEAIKVATKED